MCPYNIIEENKFPVNTQNESPPRLPIRSGARVASRNVPAFAGSRFRVVPSSLSWLSDGFGTKSRGNYMMGLVSDFSATQVAARRPGKAGHGE
jgi:hypothetical protein